MKTGLKKCITLLVFVLKLCTCAVNLIHNTLECGKAAQLECAVNPLADVRWDRNALPFLSCYISGSCDVDYAGEYSFSMNTTTSISTIIINPLAYSNFQNVTFSCSDNVQISTVIFDISVPLTEVTIQESKNGTRTELTATSNCVKTDIGFTWSCVSSEDVTQTVADNCNVSSIRTSGNSAGCTTGGNCSGLGLETKSHVLSFEEYKGIDYQTVKLAVKATHGTTTLTTVSNNIYAIRGL